MELFHVHIKDRRGETYCMWIPYNKLADMLSLDTIVNKVRINASLMEAVMNHAHPDDDCRINVSSIEVLEAA